MKKRILHLGIMCVIIAIGTLVFAVPSNQVTRVEINQTFTAACCFSFGESVTITEPKTLVPVVVTLSTDYRSTSFSRAGISVNGHECLATAQFTPSAPADGSFASHTFQWVISPSDGLIKGSNTITLCGGMDGNGSLTLGFNTLAARISK